MCGYASVVFPLKTGSVILVLLCSVIWDCTLDTVTVMLHRLAYYSQESWVLPAGNHLVRLRLHFCLLLVGSGSSLPSVPQLCWWALLARVLWALNSGLIILQFSKPMLSLCVCPAQAQLESKPKTCVPFPRPPATLRPPTHTVRGCPVPAPFSGVFSLFS